MLAHLFYSGAILTQDEECQDSENCNCQGVHQNAASPIINCSFSILVRHYSGGGCLCTLTGGRGSAHLDTAWLGVPHSNWMEEELLPKPRWMQSRCDIVLEIAHIVNDSDVFLVSEGAGRVLENGVIAAPSSKRSFANMLIAWADVNPRCSMEKFAKNKAATAIPIIVAGYVRSLW